MSDTPGASERMTDTPASSNPPVSPETPPISLVSERLLVAYAEAVVGANQRGGDGSSEDAELNLRRRISMLENYVYAPATPLTAKEETPPEPELRTPAQEIEIVRNLRHWTGSVSGPKHDCKCDECRAIKQVCRLATEALAMKASRRNR